MAENRTPRALKPGAVLNNRYIIKDMIGAGGFGITYLGLDQSLNQPCAIKEYFPIDWATRSDGTLAVIQGNQPRIKEAYEHGKAVFINEARILVGLQQENAVVNAFDYFEANNTAYIVMEYISGTNLSKLVRGQGVLSIQLANRMLQEMADALYRIHKKMLLHRDISPDNIIVREDGVFKLIDFGATRAYAINEPQTMSVMVKPGFAPIEQYMKSGAQGPWSDIYALAATYYFVLTRKKIPAAPDREMGVEVEPLKELVPDLPDKINAGIMRALSRSYKDRPQTMKEFVMDLGFTKRIAVEGGGTQVNLAKPRLRLKGGDGPNDLEWEIPARGIRIGRDQKRSDICFADQQISGLHVEIIYDRNKRIFMIQNQSKTNPVYIGQTELGPGKTARISSGEWFSLRVNDGSYDFRVEVR